MEERADWNGTVAGAEGEPVTLSLYQAPASPAPVVVFVHGSCGFKDWGSWRWMARRLAERGTSALLVNLSHNGVVGHSQEFTRLDLFERDTWSGRLVDLSSVLRAIREGGADLLSGARIEPGLDGRIDPARVALMGHSMGGGLVLLAAAAELDAGRPPAALVTLAAVSGVRRFTPEQEEVMRQDGYFVRRNARTGQELRVGLALLEDIERHGAHLDIVAAAAALGRANAPLLVCHGLNDEAVGVREAERILAAARADGGAIEELLVPETGHTFGTKHPPDDDVPAAFQTVVDGAATFLARSFGSGRGSC